MNVKIFNITLLLGWLLAVAGGLALNVGYGLLGGGLLLIALAFAVARMVGLYVPGERETDEDVA